MKILEGGGGGGGYVGLQYCGIKLFFKRYFQYAVLWYHRALRYALSHPFG